MFTDRVIIDEVRDALAHDARIPHPSEVAVSERHGTVILRGSVGSPQQRHAAVQTARSVRGVMQVEDELRVDLLDHWDDDQLRGAALQALLDNGDVPSDRIDIDVGDGWLTLRGVVKHQSESNAAFEAVSGLPGVGGITNKITVITAGIDG